MSRGPDRIGILAGLLDRMEAADLDAPETLVAGDGAHALARAAGFSRVTCWSRRLSGADPASAWPPEGPFARILLRLPKAKAEEAMLCHLLAARLRPGGEFWLLGFKDEGIGSAGKRLAALFARVEDRLIKAHARILVAEDPQGLLPPESFALHGERFGRPWLRWPGLFSAEGPDPGSTLLLRHLPVVPPGAPVLDLGCGDGLLLAALPESPGRIGSDNDLLALEAAAENVPGARLIAASGMPADLPPLAALISNPPIHDGVTETLEPLRAMLAALPKALAPSGLARIVVQRRIPVAPLTPPGISASVVIDADGYRLWDLRRP